MNAWANVGDLVFVLDRDNAPIPCKVVKEIGVGAGIQLFFEPIEEKDANRIPKIRLKAFLSQVGYNGGYVFKKKQNALDYLEEINTKGTFNVGAIIGKKTARMAQKQNKQHQIIDVQKIKEEATNTALKQVYTVMIAAMLLALNSKLGIGPKRGAELIEEINNLIEKTDKDKLIQMAEDKMKIKLK